MAQIGFDISMLVYVGSGVATYTYNLVRALLEVDQQNEYHLFYSSLRRPKNFYYLDKLKKLDEKIHSYRFPPKLMKMWWGKWHIIPIEWFTGKMDYFHTSDFLRPPLLKNTKGITTVHDLTWKKFPQWHTEEIITAHERKIIKTIQCGDIIICPSEHTKKDLIDLYPEVKNSNQVHVIAEGVEEKFQPVRDNNQISEALTKYKIKQPYIVYVGAIEPRKNLKRLIKAYSKLIKEKKFNKYNLVIGGRAGWKNQDIFDLVDKLNLKNKVTFTGFIDDKDLPAIYSAAECCCYVSLYEGFGLPPLEAQACGCTVIASNVSSLPEVLGNSAVLVNPREINEIQKGIQKALNQREKYINKGLKNSKKYSWIKTASELIRLFN